MSPAVSPASAKTYGVERVCAELVGKIQADLARSPFQGEGHRKVWA